MPDKAYAILLSSDDEGNGYLYFPIKRDGLVFGGMPQFFGGTKNPGESDRDTIAREMLEESDNKLKLESGGLKRVYSSTVAGDKYNFYVALNYTGQHFLGSLNNQEMQSIQKFYVQAGQIDEVDDLLRSLNIQATRAFAQSETYEAFTAAIKWSEGGEMQARVADKESPAPTTTKKRS